MLYRIISVSGRVAAWLVLICAMAVGLCAAESIWVTDFEAAKAKAKAEKKLLLVDFTGSDWCGWCIRLRNEVFEKEEFIKNAPKQFVLVELDFPREKELPEKLKVQNEKLAGLYKVRGFPTVLMMDAEGEVIARTGYRPGGAEEYLKHLTEFVKVFEGIPPLKAALEKAEGLARAKILDQLIESYEKLDKQIDTLDQWTKEIISLDAKNEAGLKSKYEFRSIMAEAAELKENQKFDEARKLIDKAIAIPGITGQQKQDAYFALGECFFQARDFPGVVDSLQKAIAAAPQSEKVASLKRMVERFSELADAQQSVAKLKSQLENTKGLERAKLLDQLIEASGKLGRMTGEDDGQQAEKWAREIVALDAENKAGLKAKYEFRVLMNEAGNALRADNVQQALKSIEKAMAIQGLKPEQLQEAHVASAICYLSQQEFQKAIDACKKALDVLPEGPNMPLIKAIMRQAETQLQQQKGKDKPAVTPEKK
jgi:thioredoxin-related protein/Tfp pilus assembly protein PilF